MPWSTFLRALRGVSWSPRLLKVVSWGITSLSEPVEERRSSRRARRGNWESPMPQKLWQFHKVGSTQQFHVAQSSNGIRIGTFPLDSATWRFADMRKQEPDGCGLRSLWGTRRSVPSQPSTSGPLAEPSGTTTAGPGTGTDSGSISGRRVSSVQWGPMT